MANRDQDYRRAIGQRLCQTPQTQARKRLALPNRHWRGAHLWLDRLATFGETDDRIELVLSPSPGQHGGPPGFEVRPQWVGIETVCSVTILVKSTVPVNTPTWAEPVCALMNQSAESEATDAVPPAVDTSNVE